MSDRGRIALVRRLQEIGLTGKEADVAVETILNSIEDGLEKDGRVVVSGFGRFTIRRRRPRDAKIPGRERQRIPARRAIHFKASPRVFQFLKSAEMTGRQK